MTNLAFTAACLLVATATAPTLAQTVEYPESPAECFRPVTETVYKTGVELGENFVASFTWFPNTDSDNGWNEIFRLTADSELSNSDYNGRNLALFTYYNDPTRLHMVTANPGDYNQNCVTDSITAPVQEIQAGVSNDKAFLYVNGDLVCEYDLDAPTIAATGILMTSEYYSAAIGQVCGLEITST